MNETLLPLDYKRAGQIEDDEINILLVNREHELWIRRSESGVNPRPYVVPQGTSPPPFSLHFPALPYGVRLSAIIDACHSGSGRLGYQPFHRQRSALSVRRNDSRLNLARLQSSICPSPCSM